MWKVWGKPRISRKPGLGRAKAIAPITYRMTRVRVWEDTVKYNEFYSMRAACEAYGITKAKLLKQYKVERVWEEGHWANVDKEYLKAVACKRFGRCMIL